MGYKLQHQPGEVVAADFTQFMRLLGQANIAVNQTANPTEVLAIGTVDATVLPAGTTIGDDVTKGLKITVDSVDYYIPLLSTIS